MDPHSLNDVIVKAEDVFPIHQQDKPDVSEHNPWDITQPDDYGENPNNIISLSNTILKITLY